MNSFMGIVIKIFFEGFNRHLIYELNSSHPERVHIDWQKRYGASQLDLNIIFAFK